MFSLSWNGFQAKYSLDASHDNFRYALEERGLRPSPFDNWVYQAMCWYWHTRLQDLLAALDRHLDEGAQS
jgi:hypothetical protein